MLQINYKGKTHNLKDVIQEMAVDQMRLYCEEKIKPYMKEVRRQGGKVIINIPYNLKDPNLKLIGLTEELQSKILAAFK